MMCIHIISGSDVFFFTKGYLASATLWIHDQHTICSMCICAYCIRISRKKTLKSRKKIWQTNLFCLSVSIEIFIQFSKSSASPHFVLLNRQKKVHKIVATHSCIRSVSIHAIIPTLTVQQTQLRIPFWLAFCRMRGSLSFICGSLIISVSPYFHSTPTQY